MVFIYSQNAMLLNAIHHFLMVLASQFMEFTFSLHALSSCILSISKLHSIVVVLKVEVVQLWPPLDKVCGSLANSNTVNALDSEVQQLKAAISKWCMFENWCWYHSSSTVPAHGAKWFVWKQKPKSWSKVAVAWKQKPAASIAAQNSGIPSHSDHLSPYHHHLQNHKTKRK